MPRHHYRITIESLDDDSASPLGFDASTHDDLFRIVERTRSRGEFDSDGAAAFALGVKLFGEALMARKDLPHLAALAPHFGEFMRALKGGAPRD